MTGMPCLRYAESLPVAMFAIFCAVIKSNHNQTVTPLQTNLENDHMSLIDNAEIKGRPHNSSSTRREHVLAIAEMDGSVSPTTPFSTIHCRGGDLLVISRTPTSVMQEQPDIFNP